MVIHVRNGNIYKLITADAVPINCQNVVKYLKMPITPIIAQRNTTCAHTTEITDFADTAVRKVKHYAARNVLAMQNIKRHSKKKTTIISNAAYPQHHPKTVIMVSRTMAHANVQLTARMAAMRTARASKPKTA